jgi:hypothetical protein
MNMSDNNCPNSKCAERFAVLETITEQHGKQLDNFEVIKDTVIEIKTIVQLFREDAEKRAKDDVKRDEILQTIGIGLSENIKKLNTVESKVCDLEQQYVEAENKNIVKVDLRDEAKQSWFKKHSLPIGISASILGALSLVAGILKIFGII